MQKNTCMSKHNYDNYKLLQAGVTDINLHLLQ